MRDYTNVNVAELTLDDALQDSDWGKRPTEVMDYFAFDFSMLRLCGRLNDEEVARVMRVVCVYVATGEIPDYDAETPAVAIMLESIIAAHERRVNKAYLNSYKAYVKGKQRGKNK